MWSVRVKIKTKILLTKPCDPTVFHQFRLAFFHFDLFIVDPFISNDATDINIITITFLGTNSLCFKKFCQKLFQKPSQHQRNFLEILWSVILVAELWLKMGSKKKLQKLKKTQNIWITPVNFNEEVLDCR